MLDLSKDELYERGVEAASAVLVASGLPLPAFVNGFADGHFGYYDEGRVVVDAARCARPPREPVRAWSFPGYKVDRTPYGVVAHECGHHAHEHLGSRAFYTRSEPPLSGYEPNQMEAFAEAFRLFVTNPDLLRAGRPWRYNKLVTLGCVPVEGRPWREVLASRGAHPRFIVAAARWCEA